MQKKLMLAALIGVFIVSGYGCSKGADKTAEKPPEGNTMPQNHVSLKAGTDFDKTKINDQVNEVINKKFPGEWSVKDITLKKGTYTENDHYGIVDEIAKNFTGSMVSLYAGDTRISNTVQGYDGRYLDYDIPLEVSETLKTGNPVFGEASQNGSKYHKAYLPIKSKDKVIGVIGLSLKEN